jgi:hypothetical protein
MEPEYLYVVSKSPPLVPVLSQIDPVHPIPFFIFFLILLFHQCLDLPSGLFPSGFPIKLLHAFLFSPCGLHALPIPLYYTWGSVQVMKLLIM